MDETYTYRAGERIELRKRRDQFVVRALPEVVSDSLDVKAPTQVSSHSSLVDVPPRDLEEQMEAARRIGATHHVYEVEGTDEPFLISDRVIVTFRAGVTPEQADEVAARHALSRVKQLDERTYLFQLTEATGVNPVKLVVALHEREPLVESVDHDLNYRATKYQLPPVTDPRFLRQWHLHTRSTSPDFDVRSSARCEEAWEELGGYGSAEVVIGVTDDGCLLSHPDFDAPGKFAGWGYFEGLRLHQRGEPDADPRRMYEAGSDHGTSCCGVAAAELDGVFTVGAAPGCRLCPVKWESDGPSLFISDSKLQTALAYLSDKVDVISNSWGVVPINLHASFVVAYIRQLAQTGGRTGKGILFLWAAGNDNSPMSYEGGVDIPYSGGWELRNGAPAWVGVRRARRFANDLVDLEGVLHVGALASTAQRSHYSNYGKGLDICAPTNNVHKYRRLTVRGLGITTVTGPGPDVTAAFGGTSSATPLVAGVAALVRSANPALTAVDVAKVLKRKAAKDLDTSGYPRTPAATYDPNPTWDISPVAPHDHGDFVDTGAPEGSWSPWFGHGRVDAPGAVAEAKALRGGAPEPDRVTVESRPHLEIPDDDPTGIEDAVTVDARGPIEDLRVSVEITHPWVGDLVVALLAPDGTRVVLHDRTGASTDDIRRAFDPAGTPALAVLLGHEAHGEWALEVRDEAALDTGRLDAWAIALDVSTERIVREETASIRIPDRPDQPVTRRLSLPDGPKLEDVLVSVDITHSWIGDLRVRLTPPGAPALTLHDRAGGSQDNLRRSWRVADFAAQLGLLGREAGGEWELEVSDREAGYAGKLNRWSLEVAPH
jgi:subtilisin-like proprotein convertase family protein